MSMVQAFLHLSKSGKGLCHLPLIFGEGSSEVWTTCKSWQYSLAWDFCGKNPGQKPQTFLGQLIVVDHRAQSPTQYMLVACWLISAGRPSAAAACSASTAAPVLSNHRNHRWGKSQIVTFPCLGKNEARFLRSCLCIFCIIQVSPAPQRNKCSWIHQWSQHRLLDEPYRLRLHRSTLENSHLMSGKLVLLQIFSVSD